MQRSLSYQRHASGWHRFLIDDTVLDIEAGGAFYDIDGDGDLDITFGGDLRTNRSGGGKIPIPSIAQQASGSVLDQE